MSLILEVKEKREILVSTNDASFSGNKIGKRKSMAHKVRFKII